jgi:hypothetical protein
MEFKQISVVVGEAEILRQLLKRALLQKHVGWVWKRQQPIHCSNFTTVPFSSVLSGSEFHSSESECLKRLEFSGISSTFSVFLLLADAFEFYHPYESEWVSCVNVKQGNVQCKRDEKNLKVHHKK